LIAEKVPGVIRAAAQYGIASRIVDLATFDITQNPWRCGELFDAIVTDPPCEFSLSPSPLDLFSCWSQIQMGFVQARNVWEGGNHYQITKRNSAANINSIVSRKLLQLLPIC